MKAKSIKKEKEIPVKKNTAFTKFLPHIISIAAFLLVVYVYFSPILEGKAIRQGDVMNYKGMSKEIFDYREKYGTEPLWTNSMFGGMPAFQISMVYAGNLVGKFQKFI